MKIVIEVELDDKLNLESWNDVVFALSTTAGSLSDPDKPLQAGEKGFVFTSDGIDSGQFIVQDRSIRNYQDLAEVIYDPADNGNQGS